MKSKFITLLLSFILFLALPFPSLAQAPKGGAKGGPFPKSSLLGPINAPPGVNQYGDLTSGGFINFITALLRTMIVLGALYSLVNFILAGYQYMSAANDPKALQGAWGRIWQSLIGLLITIGSFILAAVIGYILTKDATFILNPKLYGP